MDRLGLSHTSVFLGSYALWQVVQDSNPGKCRISDCESRMNFVIRHSSFVISSWGCSSVGRAVALQAIGQEFESPQLHQLSSPECGVQSAELLIPQSAFRTPHLVWACS